MTGIGRDDKLSDGGDQRLIDRLLAGEAEAEDEFLSRFRGLAIGLARGRFSFEPLAANEVWQEVVLKLWAEDCKALRSWRGEGRFTTYLTVIVVRICLRRRQAHSRRAALTEPLERAAQVADPARGPGHEAARRERRNALDQALCELSPRDRLLLRLHFQDGHKPSQIARLLKLTPGSVRKALFDARKRIRKRLLATWPELFSPADGNDSPPERSHSSGGSG